MNWGLLVLCNRDISHKAASIINFYDNADFKEEKVPLVMNIPTWYKTRISLHFAGMGLGKNEAGMKEPLRPKLKFDYSGIGHDPWKELTSNWWSNVYDTAAAKVIVSPAHVSRFFGILTNVVTDFPEISICTQWPI